MIQRRTETIKVSEPFRQQVLILVCIRPKKDHLSYYEKQNSIELTVELQNAINSHRRKMIPEFSGRFIT